MEGISSRKFRAAKGGESWDDVKDRAAQVVPSTYLPPTLLTHNSISVY